MVPGKTPFSRRAAGRRLWQAAMVAALLALAACSPVETWRDWTGASKNDPDPETTSNTMNLAAGEASDYPNLATVPPPPTRALTTAERENLTQSLIADRTNAKYTDEKLRAGFSAISAPVPPPPPPVPPAAAAEEKPAKPGDKTAVAEQGPGPRKPGEPPEPGPKESSLEAPQPRATPSPEATRPPPPPPAAAHAAGAPGQAPLPTAIDTAKYQPPPPPPTLTEPPAGSAAPSAAKKPSARAAVAPLAEIKFAGSSTTVPEGEQAALAKVVSSYREHSGKVRVVGYAGVGSGATEQLASYRVALDRAQAVAAALAKAGIPSGNILAEVAPAATDSGEGRAEVLLER